MGGNLIKIEIQILKREKSFSKMKTFFNKCLAKEIKMSNFLGGNSSRILNFLS